MSTISRHQAGTQIAGQKTGGQFKATEKTAAARSTLQEPSGSQATHSASTPEQVAADMVEHWKTSIAPAWGDGTYTPNDDQILEMIASAVAADRAHRAPSEFNNALAEQVYDCLNDRETAASRAAAEWVKENENDEFWDQYVGPMLDRIELDHAPETCEECDSNLSFEDIQAEDGLCRDCHSRSEGVK